MMSLATIREISREQATRAARLKKTPFIVEKEDLEDWRSGRLDSLPFPFLGDYVPKGYKRTEREPLFVDSSGFGEEGEPALTIKQFLAALTAGKAYAIIEQGQFQLYVAEYDKL